MNTSEADLRARIRATLMPGFAGTTAPPWLREQLSASASAVGSGGHGLLAVAIYGDNVRSRDQLSELVGELRAAAPHLLVGIDEEGGEVTRLFYREGAPYPGPAVLGRIDDDAYTREIGSRVARDVRACGFNLLLAPDADVNSDPRNPVIGTRSFGAEPEVTARHVAEWVRGAQGHGVAACPKHFPGHGDTVQDSHLALPAVDALRDTVVSRDLPPFRAAIDAGALAVMTSHILVPHLDPSGPATFSRAILCDLLRGELGFEGVIVSDALDMAGASGTVGIPEAAVRALGAGCDLLCLGPDTTAAQVREIEDHAVTAVHTGRLDLARLTEAAARVRHLAATLAADAASAAASHDHSPLPGVREIQRVAASFAGAAQARDWCARHPDAVVVEIGTSANMAVGAAPWGPFAAAAHPLPGTERLAARFTARRRVRVTAGTSLPWAGTREGVIAIGRGIERHGFARAGIDSLRAAGVPVLTVEMGWPGTGYRDVATYGSSRLEGAALLMLLEPVQSEGSQS